MNISFGKKVPIMQCQVQHIKTGNAVPSTIYEYDCEDKDDAYNIDNIGGYWLFKPQIFHQAKDKFSQPNKYCNTKIYSLETNKGETLGMMVTEKSKRDCNVEVLETKFISGHKYVGTSLLVAAAKETLRKGYDKLIIKQPITEARPFYINGCGFKETTTRQLEMPKDEIYSFINQTARKTQVNGSRG